MLTTAEMFERRRAPGLAVADMAEAIARACHDMAIRFDRGGKLIAFGNGGASSDAQHVAVEFLHPVIVGKRALPAVSLTNDVATVSGIANREGWDEVFAYQLRRVAAPGDIALGLSDSGRCANVRLALAAAKERGLLTVALAGAGALGADRSVDHHLAVRSSDPQVIKEVHVTIYHLLWELVHVFLEQPGVLRGEPAR